MPKPPRVFSIVLLLVSAISAERALAAPEAPLRVHLECQRGGRTKACPVFLEGLLRESPRFHVSPRAGADVVAYVNATAVAARDRVHLRFVADLDGVPPVVEATAELDPRDADDVQRAALRAALLRGVTPHLAAARPPAQPTSPWGLALELAGRGHHSRGDSSLDADARLRVARVVPGAKERFTLGTSFDRSRYETELDDRPTTLEYDARALDASASISRNLAERWALGAHVDGRRETIAGQSRILELRGRLGLEWDAFAADDPRGNRLAFGYQLGYDVQRYSLDADLGGDEGTVRFPGHALVAHGSVRHDRVSYKLFAEGWSELRETRRRFLLTASPSVEVALGDHVDLALYLTLSKNDGGIFYGIDPTIFERETSTPFTSPFIVRGGLGLRFHWDRDNGVADDRFGRFD